MTTTQHACIADVIITPTDSGFDGGIGHTQEQNLNPAPLLGLSDVDITVDGLKTLRRTAVRSSVACTHCRQAKVKCENDGGQRPCHTCIRTGRKCEYANSNPVLARRASGSRPLLISSTVSANGGSLKRDDNGRTSERSCDRGPDRKRMKRADEARRLDPQSSCAFYADEVISASYLTETVWTEIFDIFRLHFATELPFLHLPTLKERMGDKFQTNLSRRSHETNLVLLGVLTLTARFHSDLVQYVTHKLNHGTSKARSGGLLKPDPWAASEFYSSELEKALRPSRTSMSFASVERVQVYLMLGLYEWSQSKDRGGLTAWMYVGIAIRMAQALGLCFGDKYRRVRFVAELPPKSDSGYISPRAVTVNATPASSGLDTAVIALPEPPSSDSTGSSLEATSPTNPESASDAFVTKEVRRRTMFSCFILDRMLSCGNERLSAIRSEDLQIQLPCSDVSFGLAEEVQTGFLQSRRSDDLLYGNQDTKPAHDNVLARFIRLIDLWGEISKYSFGGGRLNEGRPPWEETTFRRLDRELESFYGSLPSALKLSTSNYHRHEHHNESSAYLSLHMLGCVCRIMLHREYIPFIPIRCPGPIGPLDAPTFPNDSPPPGFWEESAEHVFRSAREIVDLLDICQTRDKLPMSGLVVFAVWTAAFVGIYAWHFPQLDVQRHMLEDYDGGYNDGCVFGLGNDAGKSVDSYGPTGTTFTTLMVMSSWLQMANTYVKYFREMDLFYQVVKEDYVRHQAKNGCGTDNYRVRLGGAGGGLEEWKLHGRKVTNNGSILPDDALMDTASPSPASSLFSAPDGGSVAGSENETVSYASGKNSSRMAASAGSGPMIEVPRSVPATTVSPVSSRALVKPEQIAIATSASENAAVPSAGVDGEDSVPAHGLLQQCLPQQVPYLQPPTSVAEQQWEAYSPAPAPQHQTQMPQVAQNFSSQSPQTYVHAPVPLVSSGLEYSVDLQQYLNRHEGMRWQDADVAIGIENFSQGDWKSRGQSEPRGVYQYSQNTGRAYTGGQCASPEGWC